MSPLMKYIDARIAYLSEQETLYQKHQADRENQSDFEKGFYITGLLRFGSELSSLRQICKLMAQPKKKRSRSMTDHEHDCNGDGDTDTGICNACRDHAGFCSECGLSECCGAPELSLD